MSSSLARRPHDMTRTGSRRMTTNEAATNQLSREGLARLHDSVAAHVAARRLPGLVTLVACGDDVHVDPIGTPAFAGDAPMARDAIFQIDTITHPIVAVS